MAWLRHLEARPEAGLPNGHVPVLDLCRRVLSHRILVLLLPGPQVSYSDFWGAVKLTVRLHILEHEDIFYLQHWILT